MQELQQAIEQQIQYQPKSLRILQYPSPLLSKVSEPVISDIKSDKFLQNLMDDMVETMSQTNGLGLSAIQVGVPLRVLVVRDDNGTVHKVINPKVIKVSEKQSPFREGCLSFTGVYLNVKRPDTATVEYWDENGEKTTAYSYSMLGRVIQHEMDHLDGKTFLDRVSSVERQAALSKLKQVKRKLTKLQKIFYGEATSTSRTIERQAKKALKLKRKAGRR